MASDAGTAAAYEKGDGKDVQIAKLLDLDLHVISAGSLRMTVEHDVIRVKWDGVKNITSQEQIDAIMQILAD